jgi:hypothetical protein
VSPDAGTTTLDFIGDSDYRRRVQRGQSTCFECLDQKDIVLQISSPSPSLPSSSSPSTPSLTSGESVIYVPMISTGGALGIIEIHGLRSSSLTNLNNFQRSPDFLRLLIAAKDYDSFLHKTRFWKLPGTRIGGTISDLDRYRDRDYSLAAYSVVQGHVIAAITELNGIPFFGGARFNLLWEDGQLESAVIAADLVECYKNTPQSLGCTSLVTEELLHDLLKIATDATEIIQSQRTLESLKRAQDSVNIPNLRDIDTTERCLGSLIGISQNFREVSFVGMEDLGYLLSSVKEISSLSPNSHSLHDNEREALSTTLSPSGAVSPTSQHLTPSATTTSTTKKYKVHMLQKKTPQMRVITRGLKKNSRQVVEEFLYHRELLELGIDPTRIIRQQQQQQQHGHNSNKHKNIFETKEDQKEAIERKLKTRLMIISDTETPTATAATATGAAASVDWIVIEVKLPSYFHWTAKPSCSRFFLSVLKARNVNHEGNQAELNSIQAISDILAKALTVCPFLFRPSHARQ